MKAAKQSAYAMLDWLLSLLPDEHRPMTKEHSSFQIYWKMDVWWLQIFFPEGHWFQFLNNPTLISPTHFHQIGELYVHIIAHIYIFYTLINRPLNWIDISCSAKHYNVQISLTTSIWFFNIPIICGYSRFDWPSKVTATIMNHDQLWSIIVNHQKPW